MDGFEITPQDLDGAHILRLSGSAGMWAVKDLERAVDAAIARGQPVVVLELSGLEFIASLAMGQFLRLATAQRDAGARAAAAAPSREVEHALRRGRIDRLLPIFPTVNEALRGVPAGPAQ